jgi:hypothetical protein
MKEFGLANFLLGIKVHHQPNSMVLSQSHYIDSPLELYPITNY